jgi:hypothetical protein
MESHEGAICYDGCMKPLAAVLLALAPAAAMAMGEHFTLTAAYVPPAKPKAAASIAVTFIPADHDVKINQEPAPRIKLEPEQARLAGAKAEASRSTSTRACPSRFRSLSIPMRPKGSSR